MHATFVTLWLQVVQPLANVHETKWTPHVKRETDVAQSYTSSGGVFAETISRDVYKWNASLLPTGDRYNDESGEYPMANERF